MTADLLGRDPHTVVAGVDGGAVEEDLGAVQEVHAVAAAGSSLPPEQLWPPNGSSMLPA